MAVRVLKFGGTSVATAPRLLEVASIVAAARRRDPVVVVVSALAGVTNALLQAARSAAARGEDWRDAMVALRTRHREAAAGVAPGADERAALEELVAATVAELEELLHGAYLLREVTPRALDRIASCGERLAAPLAAAALRRVGTPAGAVDARQLLVTDRRFGAAGVLREVSDPKVRAVLGGDPWLLPLDAAARVDERAPVPVVTGFLGASASGETTTLGRGGSDLTAALLGAALGAAEVEIWTDVSGVLSADPRVVPAAFPLPELTYDELMELSHFGAKVVYPPTVHPARAAGIPLWIKNTFAPDDPGTRVADDVAGGDGAVRGLASIAKVALLRLEGDGMVGVPGIAARLFGALAREAVSVILITQASSEHSICVAVQPDDVERAVAAVGEEFRLELAGGLVDPLVVETDLAIVAAVGSSMRERPGIAGRVFGVLGRRGVNVRAIAQGSSELNISLVVASADEAPALRALHDELFALPGPSVPAQPAVRVYVAGLGGVGRSLVTQLAEEPAGELVLAGAARRGQWVQGAAAGLPADPERLATALAGAPHAAALGALATAALADPGPRVFVDVTASDETISLLPGLLAAGCAVVAANKRPFAGELAAWRAIQAARRAPTGAATAAAVPLGISTTVGAGLPFVELVADLVAAGDRIERLEGVLSGTMSFLLGRLAAGEPFAAAVRAAHAAGFTEPDPRDDLGGADVARKLLILARAAGVELEPEAVDTTPLLPADPWWALPVDELWRRLDEADAAFAARLAAAAERGHGLAYLARLVLRDEAGAALARPQAEVGLVEVPRAHAAAALAPGENVLVIHTARYRHAPLVVRGPGAGPALTAAGVLADIRRAVVALRRDAGAEARR